jgi:hypothetical protein
MAVRLRLVLHRGSVNGRGDAGSAAKAKAGERMERSVDIDISEPSDCAGLVFAANYVLVAFAVIGVGLEAGQLLFSQGASGEHGWERNISRPVISALMLLCVILLVRLDYSASYWRWHAWAAGIFAAVILSGIAVALVTVFEASITFIVVTAIFLAMFSPIVLGILGLLGSAMTLLANRIEPYDVPLTKLLADVDRLADQPGMAIGVRNSSATQLLGNVLTALAIAGIAAVPLLFALAAALQRHDPALEDALAGHGAIALFALPLWGVLLALGRRLAQPNAERLLATDGRPPVLLLRSFSDDPQQVRARNVLARYLFLGLRKDLRLEAAISGELSRLGPFVAIGQPGERLPQLGAARAYFTDDEWQTAVIDWMERARLVVMVAGLSNWVTWELRQLALRGQLGKLLILLPPGEPEDRASRWQLVADCLAGSQAGQSMREAPPDDALAVVPATPDGLTIIRSKTTKQVDYELAIRIALYGMTCRTDDDIDPFG